MVLITSLSCCTKTCGGTVISRCLIFNDAVIHLLHPSRTDLENAGSTVRVMFVLWCPQSWGDTLEDVDHHHMDPHRVPAAVICSPWCSTSFCCYCFRSVVLCRVTGGTSPRFISNIHTYKLFTTRSPKLSLNQVLSFLKKGSSFLYQPIGTLTGPNPELQGWQTHLMFWLLPWSCYY